MGRSWRSERGAGIWLTLIERPRDPSGARGVVAPRRVGAGAGARAICHGAPVRLKWPNDLYVGAKKLGGILIEARWREQSLEWLAIGVGINLRPPAEEPGAVGLRDGVSRDEVLEQIVPAIRAAASRVGTLDERRDRGVRDPRHGGGSTVQRADCRNRPRDLAERGAQGGGSFVGRKWAERDRSSRRFSRARRRGREGQVILVFDVGNTELTIGLFSESELRGHWRIMTDVARTPDEFGVLLRSLLASSEFAVDVVDERGDRFGRAARDGAAGRGVPALLPRRRAADRRRALAAADHASTSTSRSPSAPTG